MMKIDKFKELVEEGYDMNIMYLLNLNSEELRGFANVKIKNWVATCIRKQLMTEELEITLEGSRLKEKYDENNPVLSPKVIDKDEIKNKFEEWWNIYPSTDYFIHKGVTFAGSQAKKVYKNSGGKNGNCWDNWRKIINEGKYSPDDVIRATKFHIDTAKDLSVKKKDNQLTYISNSERYLRMKSFEPYIDISKQIKTKTIDNNDTFI